MAYYYITTDYKVFEKVGARKVKMIYGSRKKFRKGNKGSEFFDAGIVFAPYMPITIQSTPIVGQARKLSAKWSVDLEQDLKAMHGVDINSVLQPWFKERPFRNTIPIHKFKAKYKIRKETKYYYDVVFEMVERDLVPQGFSGVNSSVGGAII